MASIWDLNSGHHLYNLTDCTDVTCLHVADEGRLLVTGSEDHRVRVWDLETPPISQTTKVLGKNVGAVSVSPCGGYCAVGGEGGTVVVCELDTLQPVQRLEEEGGGSGSINHIVVLRDARTVVTAAEDGLLRMWDGEEGKCIQVFGASGVAAATCVAVSHDGTLIMSGDREGKVVVWSAKSGRNLHTFADHKQAVVGVGFARGNAHHLMLSASADGTLCLRDFVTGKVVGESRLHKEALLCLALSPDSNFLVTGSRDRSAQVVPLPGGLPFVVMSGHKGAVTCVEVFSDCETCLTGSEDRTLRMWSTGTGRCLGSMFVDDVPLACAVGRGFTILYGSHHGWVSTAAYLPGSGGTRDHLLKKLLRGDVEPALKGDVGLDEFDGSTSESSVTPSLPLVASRAVPVVARTTVPMTNEDKEQPLESDEPMERCSKPLRKEQTLESGERLLHERPLESEDCEVNNRDDLKGTVDSPHGGNLVRQVEYNREHKGVTERQHMYNEGGTVNQQHRQPSYKVISTLEGPPILGPNMVRQPQSSRVITTIATQGILEEKTPKTASPVCGIL